MRRPRSSTENREHVYRALRSAEGPISAYQVLDRVREHGITAPPTVYRSLDHLIEEGRVHRLESMNAYVACSDPAHEHQVPVFAICRACGRTQELSGGRVLEALQKEAKGVDFAMERATVEIRGLCDLCARRAAG